MNWSIPFLSLVFAAIAACKSVHSGGSNLQHTWGETQRGPHQLNCQDEESFDPLFQSYIHKHILHLGRANATVFTQGMEPEKFCAMPIEAEEIDAGASADGTLVINTGLLRATHTDAQFAAAIAHELAHITLNHGDYDLQSFVDLHPQYREKADPLLAEVQGLKKAKRQFDSDLAIAFPPPRFKAINDLLNAETQVFQRQFNMSAASFKACQILTDLKSGLIKSSAYAKALAAVLSQESNIELCSSWEQKSCALNENLIKADYQSRTILSNWVETEADEVGLEFFLRAGYEPNEYQNFFRNIDKVLGHANPEQGCVRGEANHPRDCWRAENASRELDIHKDSIPQPFHQPANFGDDLSVLIKAYRNPQP